MIDTRLLPATPEGVAEAARILAGGGLVALPTETVYGLAGDARNDRAVARIFEAKGRPQFNPLIVHVPDLEAARRYARFDAEALRLAETFWPGPLTLVLPLEGEPVSPLVSAGLPTVAIRVPAHPLAQRLMRAFGGPLAAPSANPSGRVSPTRPEHVLEGLAGRIEAVLDGSACEVGVESTIVAPGDPPLLLRPGGLPVEALEDCIGQPLITGGSAERPSAPGQLSSHYAPDAPVRLGATEAAPDETWIGFGRTGGPLNLSPGGDLVEAAANLFHLLRQADRLGRPIAVAPVPERGLGRAINDRLRRAASPRP
ncbi:L-threonylcarbamoyladenylate synthase [Cereibacter azotoformans]|uniref:L-threonylcarbamoyladenylate synthase n=1 Tax=Cereibacter azotoformans TaxID=43057 RepID=UPI003B22710E